MRTILPYLLLAGCTAKGDDAATDDTSTETGDTEESGANEFTPEVSSIDRVECTEQQSAGEVWSYTITVTDPQGADSVDEGKVYARDPDGTELASYDFPCDDSGSCSGSFRAAYDNLPCSMGGTLVLGFQVTDQNGNNSAEISYYTK